VTWKRQRGNVIEQAQIFGGVNLSSESKAVKTYSKVADLKEAPPAVRPGLERQVTLAETIERALPATITATTRPLAIQNIKAQEHEFHAVTMPGANTRALAPCRLNEVDLTLLIEGGHSIQLVRSFHSFYNATGPWGPGWALDLPRLDVVHVPVRRESSRVEYQQAFELVTPLNSLYARFSEVRQVPALNNSQLQVPDGESPFHGLADAKPALLTRPTRQLFLKNGAGLHGLSACLAKSLVPSCDCNTISTTNWYQLRAKTRMESKPSITSMPQMAGWPA